MGGQEVFVGGGRLWKTVASMEAQWSGREIGGGGGHRCFRIGLIDGQDEMRLCEILSPTKNGGTSYSVGGSGEGEKIILGANFV